MQKKMSRRIKMYPVHAVMFPSKRVGDGNADQDATSRAKQAAYLLERASLVGDVFERMMKHYYVELSRHIFKRSLQNHDTVAAAHVTLDVGVNPGHIPIAESLHIANKPTGATSDIKHVGIERDSCAPNCRHCHMRPEQDGQLANPSGSIFHGRKRPTDLQSSPPVRRQAQRNSSSRVVLRHVSGNIDEVHAAAISTFKIAKLIAQPEHHFAGNVDPIFLSIPADCASQFLRRAAGY